MKFVGRIGITLVTALVVMMAMVEARTDRAHAQTGADTLRLAFSMPFKTLDPYQVDYGAQSEIYPFLYSFLMAPRRDGGFTPDLAVSWVMSDRGKKWTFHLRPEARFHDGSPVTAADVDDSLRRAFSENAVLKQSVRFSKPDGRHRLTIALKNPVPNFLYRMSGVVVVPQRKNGRPGQDEQPVGSGPFYVHRREQDRRVILRRFDGYYGKKPGFNTVALQYESDKEKIWMDFLHGQVHACWNLSPENARYLRLEPDRYKLHEQLQPAAILLLFNLKYSLFSDRLTRLALANMLDIRGHINKDLGGLAGPCPGPLGRLFRHYPAGRAGVPLYNPEQARKNLAAAGWADRDGDGYLERNGRPFEFGLLVPQMFQTERMTAAYIQRALNGFGIRMHIKYLPFDQIMAEKLRPDRFHACLTQHSTNTSRLRHLPLLWSSQADGRMNFSGYAHPRVDRALQDLTGKTSLSECVAPLLAIHEQLTADLPAVWLYQSYNVHAFSARLQEIDTIHPSFYVTYPLLKARLQP